MVVGQTKVAADDVLQETHGGVQMHGVQHVGEDRGDRVEALSRGADIVEAHVIEQDLLDDERGDGFGQLGAGFHDAQAQGNDLGLEQEINDIGIVDLDQGTDNS